MTTQRLQDWVARQAGARPDALAVSEGEEALTYGELNAFSNRVAAALRERGCRAGDRVCLLLPKTPRTIGAILGTLKAGCIYVPLDPESPVSRLASMIRKATPRVLLVSDATGALERKLAASGATSDVVLGRLDAGAAGQDPSVAGSPEAFTLSDADGGTPDPPPAPVGPSDPAYILFTSGSTGMPKGVVITHGNVASLVEWAVRHFELGPDDRLSGHSPLCFDLSVLDIFGAFAAGASLHLVPRRLNILPHRLMDFIREERLTQWFSVPSLLSYLARFDAVGQDDLPALRRVLWCGEVFPTPALVHWMRRLPHVRFTNLYGPTETTVASSHHTVPECPRDETAEIPLGRACEGEELLVLDEEMRPVPPGRVGELFIRGVGVGVGYWEDEERTRAAFVPDPRSDEPSARMYRTGDLARVGSDGLIYFLGRVDDQIKSRGYRIELGEVETALHTLPELREGAVVAVSTGDFDGTAIGCAYSLRPGVSATPATLRSALSRRLPDYMLPVRWRDFERLPRNVNGKIDRRRLQELLNGTP